MEHSSPWLPRLLLQVCVDPSPPAPVLYAGARVTLSPPCRLDVPTNYSRLGGKLQRPSDSCTLQHCRAPQERKPPGVTDVPQHPTGHLVKFWLQVWHGPSLSSLLKLKIVFIRQTELSRGSVAVYDAPRLKTAFKPQLFAVYQLALGFSLVGVANRTTELLINTTCSLCRQEVFHHLRH